MTYPTFNVLSVLIIFHQLCDFVSFLLLTFGFGLISLLILVVYIYLDLVYFSCFPFVYLSPTDCNTLADI